MAFFSAASEQTALLPVHNPTLTRSLAWGLVGSRNVGDCCCAWCCVVGAMMAVSATLCVCVCLGRAGRFCVVAWCMGMGTHGARPARRTARLAGAGSTQFISELEQQMPRTTFLAPTDEAFKTMDLESVQNLLGVNSDVDHNELIRKFFKLHKLKKEYVHGRHTRLQPLSFERRHKERRL
jgi:hypothetical protein